MQYAAIEPFGEYRSELRHGQLMQLTDAAHFKRDTPAKVSDFMNFIEKPEPKPLTPTEISARFKTMFGVA